MKLVPNVSLVGFVRGSLLKCNQLNCEFPSFRDFSGCFKCPNRANQLLYVVPFTLYLYI
jgi:hypothetical protein